jgi:cytochrome bd-type quinol oxidase subunit 2
MVLDLVPLWTALLALAVFYYVVFDGFDLGVGLLYGFVPSEAGQAIVMSSVVPVWDGNETWLVFGGLGLLAAFPLAFAIIIPAVYFQSSSCCLRSCSAASPLSSGSSIEAYDGSGIAPSPWVQRWRHLHKG